MGISEMFSETDADFSGLTEDENNLFVNEFKLSTTIKIDYNIIYFNSSIDEQNGFDLVSQFIFIVAEVETKIPLLIGKFKDTQTTHERKYHFCKIPDLENGYIVDLSFGETFEINEEVSVEDSVNVKCHPGYVLNYSGNAPFYCRQWGWDDIFPKCISNI